MGRSIGINKQDGSIQYVGTGWTGLGGGIEVQLADPINASYGFGAFNTDKVYANQGAGGVGFAEGTHFQYNKRLDASTTEDAVDGFGTTAGGIIDTAANGVLSKAIRLVESTNNIKSGFGYPALKVYAKDLAILKSPSGDQCYIDPIKGKFILPRPVYWSKCENIANIITSPEIYSFAQPSSTSHDYTVSSVGGKFNNGTQFYHQGWPGYMYWLYTNAEYTIIPISNNLGSKFTFSLWHYFYSYGYYWAGNIDMYAQKTVRIGNELDYVEFINYNHGGASTGSIALYANGTQVAINNNPPTNGTWYHTYLVVDKNKGLAGSASMQLYMNGTILLSTTANLSNNTTARIYIATSTGATARTSSWQSYTGPPYGNYVIDNIKLWNDAIENISWEYNGGTGREDALHYIYGSVNGYKPINIKNGYFYMSTSISPATCAKPGADAPVQLEDATEVLYGYGKFGLGTVLKKSDYYPLEPNVDYAYDKRLDASTTQDAVDGFGTTAGGVTDTNASGILSAPIRLVTDSKNVKDPTGLNLKVYAKDLSIASNLFPLADRCYIDPARGTFVLPRPTYWSKCESVANLISPEIYNTSKPSTKIDAGSYSENTVTTGIFNNCWYRYNGIYTYNQNYNSGFAGDTQLFPLGQNIHNFNKFTVSKWFHVTNYINSTAWNYVRQLYTRNYFEIGDISKVGVYVNDVYDVRQAGGVAENVCALYLVINSSVVSSVNITRGAWNHIYLIVDKDKGLDGGKSVRVFINGTEVLNSTATLPDLSAYTMRLYSYLYVYHYVIDSIGAGEQWSYAYTRIDNIKIWDHVVSEDPTWESGGTKTEDSLHYIYGSTNGYKPVLTGGAGGVGYYKSGGSGTYAKWNI